jgi:transcriptional regulator with XRE-family HTH domain
MTLGHPVQPARSPGARRDAARDALARLLADARRQLGISQLELALRLGVSQRHVAFVERGRAGASRSLLLQWTRETRSPGWLRNAILFQAGYIPTADDRDADEHPRPPRRSGESLGRILSSHHPYPAHAFDADWTIVDMNPAARWLCKLVMPAFVARLKPGDTIDMIAACMEPDGLLSRMENGRAFALNMLAQLRAEATVSLEIGERADAFERAMSRRYGSPKGVPSPGATAVTEAVFALDGGQRLCFSIAKGAFGLPHDMAVGARRVELWFPIDAHTRDVMRSGPGATPDPADGLEGAAPAS